MPYRQLVELLWKVGRNEEAFRYSQHIRARLLAESLEERAHPWERALLPLPEPTEPVRFSKIRAPLHFTRVSGAAMLKLLVASVYKLYPDGPLTEETAKATLQSAGYDVRANDVVSQKIQFLRARGLENHLTALFAMGQRQGEDGD